MAVVSALSGVEGDEHSVSQPLFHDCGSSEMNIGHELHFSVFEMVIMVFYS